MPSDMFTESENSDLKTEVELIKRDLTGIANLVDRFDIAIEKLGDISDGMNRVLAVHELRLENQTKELALL
jgi:predicted transcriptional regulator